MNADLTCKPCEGTGYFVCKWPGCEQRHPSKRCSQCGGRGRRPPTLGEWDALKAERDEIEQEFAVLASERDGYRLALEMICQTPFSPVEEAHRTARAALDSDPDLAERTRRIRADE